MQSLSEPSIEDLLKTNQPPSTLAAQEARNLLLKPLKDLEDIEAEIVQLKNRLTELEHERNETEKRISQYKLILSPIRRVPSEVLGEIFYQCLPTDRNPIMKSSDCPLLLTRICTPWRTVAMSTPKLWDRLYITFTDYDTVPDIESIAEMVRNGDFVDAGWGAAQSKSQKQETTKLLRRRYEAVREWISRSGTRPLAISIRWTRASWYTVPYSERTHGVTMELLSFLARISPRWKDFEYTGPVQVYQALENLLMASRMTTLNSLKCDYYQDSMQSRPNSLFETPNLQELSISGGGSLNTWGITLQSESIHWKQLTTIVFSISLSITDAIFVLERASNLIRFEVHMHPVSESHTITSVSDTPIYLPFLRTLSIGGTFNFPGLFDRIDSPKLQELTYVSTTYHTQTLGLSESVLPLLRQTQELQKLIIDMNNFMQCDVGSLIRAVPSITDLVIGHEDEHQSHFPSFIRANYDLQGNLIQDLWSFTDLIVDDFSVYSVRREPPLLPRLKSLVISSQTAQVSDNTLFDLIKSRMMSTTVVPLERVRLVSFRERERDIQEELTRLAMDVGVKIDMKLQYAKPPPVDYIPTSPEFGLRKGNTYPFQMY